MASEYSFLKELRVQVNTVYSADCVIVTGSSFLDATDVKYCTNGTIISVKPDQ